MLVDGLSLLKLGSAFSILVMSFVCVLPPVAFRFFQDIIALEKLLDSALAFSGGIFLGTAVVHLIPESLVLFSETVTIYNDYPVPAFFTLLAIYLFLFIDFVLFRGGHHDEKVMKQRINKMTGKKGIQEGDDVVVGEEVPILFENENNFVSIAPHGGGLASLKHRLLDPIIGVIDALALLIMISTHAFFVGVAMGFQEDFNSVIVVLIAILSHKWAEALAVSVFLARSEMYAAVHVILVTMFSLVTPFGILAGMALSAPMQGDLASIVNALLQALASGTFIYVGLVECTTHVLSHEKDRIFVATNFLLSLCGILFMSVIRIFF